MQTDAAQQLIPDDSQLPLIGLAKLAKIAFAGGDLTSLGSRLLGHTERNPRDANALMDLSIVLHLTGQREMALDIQTQALMLQPLYSLEADHQPARVRLLAFLSPGDLTENNALEFLVEESDIALDLLYIDPALPFPEAVPDHDLAMVAVCESDRNRPLLHHIEAIVESWPRPVLNAPGQVARLSRDGACAYIQSQPGIVMPGTARIDRHILEQIGRGELPLRDVLPDGAFPMIVRPVDSHKGQGLMKLEEPAAIAGYLAKQRQPDFYIARFVDYRGADGLFRKYRVLFIDDRPYLCHMAISSHWMVHYMNAGMTESAEKRAEEARAMAGFDDDFADRHRNALATVAQQLELEYVGIDCGETLDGELLIFEVDSGMTVHAMDSIEMFPYKQPQMRKVFNAFRTMLMHRQANAAAGSHASETH